MRTAEEVAEKIVHGPHGHSWLFESTFTPDQQDWWVEQIAQTLTAYAEERVKEAEEEWRNMVVGFRDTQKARAEALEEAAKVTEYQECSIAGGSEVCNCDIQIAEAIRALKSKP